ncbi:MAG: hypothetical protein AAF960_26500 [Bacteroidota bacterium]
MTHRNQIVGFCNGVTEPEIGKPKSRLEVAKVNLAEPSERVMSYLGRSWTSFVVLAAKKSAEVIVGAQTLSNVPSFARAKSIRGNKKKEMGQERPTPKD